MQMHPSRLEAHAPFGGFWDSGLWDSRIDGIDLARHGPSKTGLGQSKQKRSDSRPHKRPGCPSNPLPGPYLRSRGAGRPRAGRRWSPRRHRKCPGPGPTRPLRLPGGLLAGSGTSFGLWLAAAAEEIVRVRPQVVQVVGTDLNRTPDAGEYGHTDARAAESAAESFSLGSVGRLIG